MSDKHIEEIIPVEDFIPVEVTNKRTGEVTRGAFPSIEEAIRTFSSSMGNSPTRPEDIVVRELGPDEDLSWLRRSKKKDKKSKKGKK